MSRTMLRTAVVTAVVATWLANSIQAQTKIHRVSGRQPGRFPGSGTSAKPVSQVRTDARESAAEARLRRLSKRVWNHSPRQTAHSAVRSPSAPNGAPQAGPSRRIRRQYPNLNAPMYPVPRPDIPHQTGGAVITNQALSPQEMLHPHQYRALYPPYYYKVSGHWMVTPGGVWSREKWELKGTEVEVKYHPRIRLLSLFSPPAIR